MGIDIEGADCQRLAEKLEPEQLSREALMRLIDRAVAERVLELLPCIRWAHQNFGSAGGPVLVKRCTHVNCYPVHEIASVHGRMGGCPTYSSSWQAAVPLMALALVCQLHKDEDSTWSAYIDLGDGRTGRWTLGPDGPIALCLAALAAVGVVKLNVLEFEDRLVELNSLRSIKLK